MSVSPITAPLTRSSQVETTSSDRLALPEFIPQFDGLRAIAILAVMATHSVPLRALGFGPFVEYGRLGVGLFFVLSGFLITGILLDSIHSPHYYRNFYARRALRIWPMYYSLLLSLLVLLPRLLPREFLLANGTPWPFLIFYLQNCGPSSWLSWPLSPTWSLAIEEQFYMIWPTLVRFLRGFYLPTVLSGLVVASLVTRVLLYKSGLPMNFVHRFTLCRLEPIALGSLAAWWIRSPCCTAMLWRRAALWSLAIGFFGAILTRYLPSNNRGSFAFFVCDHCVTWER